MKIARSIGLDVWLVGDRTVETPMLAQVVVEALNTGRAAILPSDTTYALCVSPAIPGWQEMLAGAKARPADRPVSLFFGSLEQMKEYGRVGSAESELLRKLLPGSYTVIVGAGEGVLGLPGGWPFDGLGMRYVDIPLLKEVCSRAGPVSATSANVHGTGGALKLDEAVEVFRDRIDIAIAVDQGELPGGHSAVVDIRGGHERVLREGEIRRK